MGIWRSSSNNFSLKSAQAFTALIPKLSWNNRDSFVLEAESSRSKGHIIVTFLSPWLKAGTFICVYTPTVLFKDTSLVGLSPHTVGLILIE